jgi:hypothetical protein
VSLRLVTDLVIGLLLCTVRGAAAERSIAVDAPGAPFEAGELVAAIRVRVPVDGPPLRVRVTATASGVRVEAGGGARDVELASLHGPAAARLVALVASDLMLDTPAPIPIAAPATAHEPTLGVLATAAGWDGVLGGLALDLVLPRGPWLVAFDAGGGTLLGGAIQLTAAMVGVDVGRREGPFEARVGVIAAPVLVTTDGGDRTVLAGARASVRARVPLGGVRVVLAAGADAYATQTEYRIAGQSTSTTPRIAPWLAVGVEVPL